MGKRGQMFHAAKRIALLPEKIDALLHGKVLMNPPLPKVKEQQMKIPMTIGEQLRAKLDETAKREALNNTLNEWDQDEQKQIKGETMHTLPKETGYKFQPTNNASRETFNFIRDNPYLRASEIVKALVQRGFKESTVSSLIYQMHAADLLTKDDLGQFKAVGTEFQPYNISKIRNERKRKQRALTQQMQANLPPARKIVVMKRRTAEDVEQARAAAGIGALVQPEETWKPEHVVDTLTLQQAKAVYVYLKNSFGG